MSLFRSLFFKQIELGVLQTLYDYNIRTVAKQVGSSVFLPENPIYSQEEFLAIEKNSFFSRNFFSPSFEKLLPRKYEVFLSYFTLSNLLPDEKSEFLNNIQKIAPKTIFVDYEIAERNYSYPSYYGFTLSQYASIYYDNLYDKKRRQDNSKMFTNYLERGAIEGFFFDLEKEEGIAPKIIHRRTLGCGGIGLCYCEW